jgi:hypothetical protein
VEALLIGEAVSSKVVEDEQLRAGEFVDEARETAIEAGERQVFEQARHARIEHGMIEPPIPQRRRLSRPHAQAFRIRQGQSNGHVSKRSDRHADREAPVSRRRRFGGRQAVSSWRVRPEVPRHELIDTRDRPAIGNSLEGLLEPAERIDAVHFCCLQHRGYGCSYAPTAFATGKETIFSDYCLGPDSALDNVGVDFDPPVGEKALEH